MDDEYCKYNDDFEPVIVEETKVSVGAKISKEIGSILDIHLNPKSAEPHLHKSKAKNLQPLQELSNLPSNVLH